MARFGFDAGEVARLQDIVGLAATSVPGPETVRALLDDLQQLMGCDTVAYFVQDASTRRRFHYQHVAYGEHVLASPEYLEAEAARAHDDPFWRLYDRSPCSRPDWAGVPVAQALSGFLSPKQWRDHPMHAALTDEAGPLVDEILMSYPEGSGRSRRLLLNRTEGPRFGERELTLAALLLPHLGRVLAATGTWPDEAAAVLTPRQREILELVGTGLANKQIATVLGISEGTVRKHLEHAYGRLGVQSRTAAVVVAFPATG